MEPRFRFRLYLLTAMVLLGTVTLLHRLHELQIQKQDYFIRQKPGLSIVTIREPGVRGEIFDRNGVAMAENYAVYELVMNLGEVRESWKRQWTNEGIDEENRPEIPPIDKIVEQLIVPRLIELGIDPKINAAAIRTHFITHRDLVPYVSSTKLNFDQFSRVAENTLGLEGVYVTSRPLRRYPLGTLAGHVLGHVQQWKKGSYSAAEAAEFQHYFGDSKGIAGIEKTLNKELTGLPGKRSLFKNEKGIIIGPTVDSRPPSAGANVTLTIDAGIQCLVENVLRRAGRATAVVMDVNTGEVLAMASLPNYDPNDYVPSLSQEAFDYYNTNKASPFTNRAVSRYQSASTTKLPVALTALMNGMTNFQDNCPGYVAYGSIKIRCHNKYGHGPMNLESAIQRSCNPYFMNLANRLGREKIVEGFSLLNLGRRTNVGLPDEKPGILPGSTAWFQLQEPGSILVSSQLGQMAIGQWQMEATPLQICAITACIANGGKYYQPRLVKKAVLHGDVNDDILIQDRPKLQVDLVAERGVRPADLRRLQQGMWRVANQPGGTGVRTMKNPSFPAAAKTGTVEVRKAEPKINNSWVTAYAPYDNPRYAITVFVEGGSSGGKVAGPLAHIILRGIAAAENNLRLPIKRMGKFAGHFDRIEQIELPEDSFLSITLDGTDDDEGEIDETADDGTPMLVTPRSIPLLSPTQDSD